MIIFQTAGGGDAGSMGLEALLDGSYASQATTFRTNDYIHHLNRALQAEMRAISTYRALLKTGGASRFARCASKHAEGHQQAGRDLVKLIIQNRGIPDDQAAISLGLTRTFVQFCSKVPARLFERATTGALLNLERHLADSYQRLLNEAPARDIEALSCLLQRTNGFIEHFDDSRF